jgi:hypothetical protein
MGVAVAGLLLLTNLRELASWAGAGTSAWLGYGAVVVLVALAALRPRLGRPHVVLPEEAVVPG